MNQEILDEIKRNSGISEKIISESDSSDIATTQDFISSLINEKYNDSLVYQICEIQPLKSSYGTVYASKLNPNTGAFQIVKKDIHAVSDKIVTGFSRETWDDMIKQFSVSARRSAGNILSNYSKISENKRLLQIIESEAEVKSSLTIPDSENFETVITHLSKKVSDSVIEMNYKAYKSLDSFCILGPKWASAILGSFDYMTEGKEQSLFVGRIGRTDYYINPLPFSSSEFTDDFNIDYENAPVAETDYVYVGLKSKTPGQSSLVFAPYMYETQLVVDPDTLDNNLFLYNRYGLITSPLHNKVEGKGMIHKFEVIPG